MRWSDIDRGNALTVTKMPDAMWAWDPADYPAKGGSVGAAGSVVVGDAGPEMVRTGKTSGTLHMSTTPEGDSWIRQMFHRTRSA